MAVRVLVTGSAGRVGGAAYRALVETGHTVRGFDLVGPERAPGAVIGNIAHFGEVREAISGVETVVHCAATPFDEDFAGKLLPNNIVGVYNVLEAARQAGVRRVILASTGQGVMGHSGPWPITPEMLVTPRNWYGAAKVLAEAAGQVYAYEHGLSIIVVRLGWCPRDQRHADELAGDRFGQDVYLSAADAGRFFVAAVEAPRDIRYRLVFATSRPVRETRYDLTAAKLLGYEPQDQWPQGTELFGRYGSGVPESS